MKMKDYGGPAFPAIKIVDGDNYNPPRRYHMPGMTLRDYFAAKAMPIMWDAYDKGYCGLNDKDEPNMKTMAAGAYQMADAMLKARKEGGVA